jgi:hypothetical protein
MSDPYSYIFLVALERAGLVSKPPFRVTTENQRLFEKEFHGLICEMNAAWRIALDKEMMRGEKLRTGSVEQELKRRATRPVDPPLPPYGEGLFKYASSAVLCLTDCVHVGGKEGACRICVVTPAQREAKYEPKTINDLLNGIMLVFIQAPEVADYRKRAKPVDQRLVELKRANDLLEAKQHMQAENAAMAIQSVQIAEHIMDGLWSRTIDEIKADLSLEPITHEALLQHLWTVTESHSDIKEYNRIIDKMYGLVRRLLDAEFEKYALYWHRVRTT